PAGAYRTPFAVGPLPKGQRRERRGGGTIAGSGRIGPLMPLKPATIETERLRLVVLAAEEIRALIAGDTERASRLAGAAFPPGWPHEREPKEGLAWHLRHIEADAAHGAWRIRVIVERASEAVVGSINLKGPPDEAGDVEIGWGIVESRRRRGYALEASSAVLGWVLSQPGVRSVTATVPEDNAASERVA